jgi:hypothetical protein
VFGFQLYQHGAELICWGPDNLLWPKYIIGFSYKINSFDIHLEIILFDFDRNSRLSPILSSVHSGLSPSRGWVQSGLSPVGVESLRGWVHSGLSPFWVQSILSSIHSEFGPFWVQSIVSSVHCEFSPFGVQSIRGWSIQCSVYSGLSLSRFSHSRFSHSRFSCSRFSLWIVLMYRKTICIVSGINGIHVGAWATDDKWMDSSPALKMKDY